MKDLVCFQDDHFIIDMMYARVDNIMSRAVYEEVGFGNKLLVHPDLKEALLSLVPELEKMNCKMRICDAYRPPVAHQKCIEAIPVKGFFAVDYQRSNHCHATAIDGISWF